MKVHNSVDDASKIVIILTDEVMPTSVDVLIDKTHVIAKFVREERATDAEEATKWAREHAEALDTNWSTLHEASMGAIRDALGMPEASVPEMVERVEQLRLREVVRS